MERFLRSSLVPSSTTQFILRPFEIQHLFDFAIRLYRSSFIPMLLAVAMVRLPMGLLSLPWLLMLLKVNTEMQEMVAKNQTPDLAWLEQHMDLAVWGAAFLFGTITYQLLVMPLGNLACSRLAVQAMHNEPVSFAEALRFSLSRYWPTQVALAVYFLPLLVISLLMLLPVLIFSLAGEAAGIAGAAAIALFVIMLAWLATALLWVRLFPALAGIVQAAEEPDTVGIVAQGMWYLKRAYAMTGGYFWRLFGLCILMLFATAFIVGGIQQGLQILVLIVQALIYHKGVQEITNAYYQPGFMAQGYMIMAGYIVRLLVPALMICFQTLLFYDLRIRKEGYDLQLMLEHAPEPAAQSLNG